MSTVNSTSSPYCTPAQYLKYADARTTGDLVGDVGQRVDPPTLLTDAVLAAALLRASGDVEAACLAGERYLPADLTALAGTAGGEYLAGLVADLALGYLYRRRPDKGKAPGAVEDALAKLAALKSGEAVFGIVEVEQAGRGSHEVETASDVEDRALTATEMSRYFGTRVNRLGG